MDQCMRFHMDYMSPEVLDHINYINALDLYRGLFDNILDEEMDTDTSDSEIDLQVSLHTLLTFDPSFFDRIRQRAFTIWTATTDRHWFAIFMHVDTTTGSIQSYTIAEPGHVAHLTASIDQRLRWLLARANIPIDAPTPTPLWFPKQLDDFSCGFRTYEVARVLLERINERVRESVATGNDLWHPSLLGPLPGDLQPQKIRTLMIGIIASRAMGHHGWRARVAVTPRRRIRGLRGLVRDAGPLDASRGLDAHQRPGVPAVRWDPVTRARRAGSRPKTSGEAADEADVSSLRLLRPEEVGTRVAQTDERHSSGVRTRSQTRILRF